MDEYLFLVVAKLKADRQKLKREQREQLHVAAPRPARAGAGPADVRGRAKLFSTLEWREQS